MSVVLWSDILRKHWCAITSAFLPVHVMTQRVVAALLGALAVLCMGCASAARLDGSVREFKHVGGAGVFASVMVDGVCAAG